MTNNNSRLVVPGAKQAIEQMKYEIANELGVKMGPDATSRANGSAGIYPSSATTCCPSVLMMYAMKSVATALSRSGFIATLNGLDTL